MTRTCELRELMATIARELEEGHQLEDISERYNGTCVHCDEFVRKVYPDGDELLPARVVLEPWPALSFVAAGKRYEVPRMVVFGHEQVDWRKVQVGRRCHIHFELNDNGPWASLRAEEEPNGSYRLHITALNGR